MNYPNLYDYPLWRFVVQDVVRATGASPQKATEALIRNWNPFNPERSIEDAIVSFSARPIYERPVIDNAVDAIREVARQTGVSVAEAAIAIRDVWNSSDMEGSVDRAILIIRGPIGKG